MKRRYLALVAITWLLCSSSPAQQSEKRAPPEEEQVTLKSELISLSVTVMDRSGRVITGLRKENFKIYEDKVEQQTSFFSSEQAPVSWGLVLDRSGSMSGMIEDVYLAALHTLDGATREDEAFIVTFSGEVDLVCDFTSDRGRLHSAISGLRAGGSTALWDAVDFGSSHMKKGKHRKKVLVVVTDGEDNSSRISFRRLLDQVEEQEVQIYTVGMFDSMGFGMGSGYVREQLQKLAEKTGGKAHFPENKRQCEESCRAIGTEVSRQYSIGYYLSKTAKVL